MSDLNFTAGIDRTQWKSDIDAIRRDLLGLNSTVQSETQKMDSSFKNLSLGIAGYFSASALKGFTMELINVRGEFQKTEIAFGTMLKSTDKAKELMGQMVELAAKTPFSLQDVSAGAKQLLAFQVPANEVVDTLTRMGNIAAGLSVPLSRINLVYGQVKAKGKLMGDDLRQFTEAGIPMVAELAKKFNTSTSAISEMVSAGKIGFKDVQDVLFSLTNEGGMFYNLMEKQSKSLSGQIANLGDAWDQMLNKIGESNEGILSDSIQEATYLIENYEGVIKVIASLIPIYGAYKVALMTTAAMNVANNKTIASEISLLGISEKMKLGRALVTQRQTEATMRETAAELANVQAKYTALQAEVSTLALKKQSAIQSGINATAKAQEARVQLTLARMELSSMQATGTARQIEIAQKNVTKAQNTVIATQESASIARKRALAAATDFNTAKQSLENTAQKVGVATKTAATAAEASQIAAKNANSVATTRLTVMQNLHSIAAKTGAKAQAFLNSTILANPYALAAAALAGLVYAIVHFSTQLSTAEEIQKEFDERLSKSNSSVAEQKAKIESLITSIKSENTTNEEKKQLLNSLNVATNNKIKGLTIEAIKTGEATGAIKLYIQQLYQQAEAMAYVDQLKDLYRKKSDNEEVIRRGEKGDTTIGEAFGALFDSDTYKDGGIKKVLSGDHWGKAIAHRAEQENKAYDIAIESTKKKIEARADIIAQAESSAGNDQVATINNTSEKVKKSKEKHEKELAEVFSKGSIADLEKRISEWNNALQRADLTGEGMVKVRKTDKYGKEYETGEVVSRDFALKAAADLEKAKAEAEKKIQRLSFDEQLAEDERQWNIRYQIAKQYGEDIAKAQFPNLKGDSYFDELNKQFKPLDDRYKSGAILSDADLKKWETLKKIIDSLNGVKDPFTNFTDGLDEGMSKLSTYAEKMEFLNKQMYSPEIMSGEGVDNKHKAEIIKRQEDLKKSWQQTYQSILEEQKTYEEKSAELANQYAKAKEADQYKNGTDSDREKVDNYYSNEASKLSLEAIKSSKAWQVAFGDMEYFSKSSLDNIYKSLIEFKEKSSNTLKPTELRELEEAINRVQIASGNLGIPNVKESFEKWKTSADNAKKAQEDYNRAVYEFGANSKQAKTALDNLISAQDNYSNATKNLLSKFSNFQGKLKSIGEIAQGVQDVFVQLGGDMDSAFGDILNNINQTIEGLNQFSEGAMQAISGFESGKILQGIAGGIKAIGGAIKSVSGWLNGDKEKERDIKKWSAAVDELKTEYEDLQRAVSKALGEDTYKQQQAAVANLRQQQALLQSMINEEQKKKKTDNGKITEWQNQINQINDQIEDIYDNISQQISGTNAKDMASQLADALIEAYGKGESAAEAYGKVADDVMKNAVKNALKMQFLEKPMQDVTDQLVKNMGFNEDGTGSFDGLTEEESNQIKAMMENASQNYMSALEAYEDLFGAAATEASSLEGAIKGVSEETASLIAGQMNAIRIVQAQMLENSNISIAVLRNSLLQLTQIEINTRFLRLIYLEVSKNSNDGSIRASGLI